MVTVKKKFNINLHFYILPQVYTWLVKYMCVFMQLCSRPVRLYVYIIVIRYYNCYVKLCDPRDGGCGQFFKKKKKNNGWVAENNKTGHSGSK
jgi:hypothetical protein